MGEDAQGGQGGSCGWSVAPGRLETSPSRRGLVLPQRIALLHDVHQVEIQVARSLVARNVDVIAMSFLGEAFTLGECPAPAGIQLVVIGKYALGDGHADHPSVRVPAAGPRR